MVDTRSFQGAINQSSSLASVESEELLRVAFDFLLGDFEDGLGNLGFVILSRCELRRNLPWVSRETYASLKLIPDLLANGIVGAFLFEGMREGLDGRPCRGR